MNKTKITLIALIASLISLESMAQCRVQVVTPCAGCMAQQQMICDYSPPENHEVPMRNGMQEFYQGAEAFRNGVNAYGNSIRR